MNLVGRLQVDMCLRQLRGTTDPSERQRSEWRTRLLSHGASGIPRLIEALAHKSNRPFVLSVLVELLNDETLPLFTASLGSPEASIAGGVGEILGSGRGFDPSRLLDLLHDPGMPKARLEGILSTHVERIPARRLVPMISELDKEPRAIVFRLLEARADANAILDALPLAQDPDWWVRLSMVRLLALVPAEPAVQSIIRLLADTNKTVRLEATRALARLKSPSAIGPLCELLRDADLRIQTGAIDALIAANDPSAVPHLVEVLKDESEKARRAAVEVLNEVVTIEAVKDLVMALRDEDWWVRARAADALGSLGGPRVIDAVVELIGDADSFVRRYAVEILNTVSSERAVEPLLAALNDEDWWVRERAIDALARIGDPRAVDPLLDLLERDTEVRGRAVEALQALLRKDLSAADRERVIECLRSAGAEGHGRSGPTSHIRANGGAADPESRRPESPRGRSQEDGEPAPVAAPGPQKTRINFQDIPIGTLLVDRYRIMRRVGGGGFGTVYLVKDLLVDEESILKVLSPQFSHDPDMIRRFVQELRLTRRITHPSVIRIHEIIDLVETHAISMEYFPSRDLAHLLNAEGNTPPARLLPMAIQVCDALQAAHELGITHRDIKPANILLGMADQVKVVDFGLAAVGMQLGSRLTKTGLLIGTPEYMSPEQITGQAVDARSDIYSLGIVLYEALSGRSPFAGESTVNVMFRHVEGNATPLHEVTGAVSEELGRVVMTAMAREPVDRFSSAGDLRQRLLELANHALPEKDVA